MKFSTKAISKMAEIMVTEMKGVEIEGIGAVETGMREVLRAVGAQALGRYLEHRGEEMQERAEACPCGEQMKYLFKRDGTILSVFGRVH